MKLVGDMSLSANIHLRKPENPDRNQEEDVNPLEIDKHVLNDVNANDVMQCSDMEIRTAVSA